MVDGGQGEKGGNMKTQIQLKPNSNLNELDKFINKIDKIIIKMDIYSKIYMRITFTKCVNGNGVCSNIITCIDNRKDKQCIAYTGETIKDTLKYINDLIIIELSNVYGDINV